MPDGIEHARFWLVDQADGDANPNLELVLDDVAEAITTLRSEGERVYVHCVGGRSRTPAAVTTYLARRDGITPANALQKVSAALPEVRLNVRFSNLLR